MFVLYFIHFYLYYYLETGYRQLSGFTADCGNKNINLFYIYSEFYVLQLNTYVSVYVLLKFMSKSCKHVNCNIKDVIYIHIMTRANFFFLISKLSNYFFSDIFTHIYYNIYIYLHLKSIIFPVFTANGKLLPYYFITLFIKTENIRIDIFKWKKIHIMERIIIKSFKIIMMFEFVIIIEVLLIYFNLLK